MTVPHPASPLALFHFSDRYDAAIQKAVEDGHALGITGTPTFFVNGQRLVGARPIEDFQSLIDAELKRAG